MFRLGKLAFALIWLLGVFAPPVLSATGASTPTVVAADDDDDEEEEEEEEEEGN
jgi:hypothetical protein